MNGRAVNARVGGGGRTPSPSRMVSRPAAEDAAAPARAIPAALADRVGFLMRRASGILFQAASAELEPFELTPQAYGILCVLAGEGPLTQNRVGEMMRIDRTTMVAIVDGLEALGAVVRRDHPEDRRAHLLGLTASGRSLVARAGTGLDHMQARCLSPLTARERLGLVRMLTKLIEHESESGEGTARARLAVFDGGRGGRGRLRSGLTREGDHFQRRVRAR